MSEREREREVSAECVGKVRLVRPVGGEGEGTTGTLHFLQLLKIQLLKTRWQTKLSLSPSRSCWPHCVKVEHLMGLNRAKAEAKAADEAVAEAEAEAFQVHSRLPIPFENVSLGKVSCL